MPTSAWGAGTDYNSIVKNAYSQNGNVAPDQEGMNWWTSQLQSGKFANQQDFNTNFNAAFAGSPTASKYIPIQAGANAPGSQGSGNKMADWMAGLQNINLTPEEIAYLNEGVGFGDRQISRDGYTFQTQVQQGTGMDNAGNYDILGYTAFKDGAPRGADDWYGQMGTDGTFQGARNPHEFDMQDATPFIMAAAAFAAAIGGAGAAAGAGGGQTGTTGAAVGGADAGSAFTFNAAVDSQAANAALGLGPVSGATSPAIGYGMPGFEGYAMTPDISSTFNAAKDSQLANVQHNLGPYSPPTPPAQYLPNTDPSVFNPAKDSQLANEQLGLDPVSTPTPPANPVNGPTATPPGADYVPPGSTPPGTTPGTTPPGTTPPGAPPGGFDWASLLKLVPGLAGILGGIEDGKNQREASDKMLEWLKSRTAITDNLYADGSPERMAMQQEMDRKDAAAGRNSQYGTRAVDLASNIAKIKASENTKMTTGIGGWMQGAYNQNASSNAGLYSSLGNLDWTGIADLITNLTKGTSTK